MEIVDNYLQEEEHKKLADFMMNVNGSDFAFFPLKYVAQEHEETPHWSWYGVHVFYVNDVPVSPLFEPIIGDAFLGRINPVSLIRAKANFLPYTDEVRTHNFHQDYPEFRNKAAVYSINTCDGYTLFADGTKVDSVANRMLFFDAHQLHCSSTTSNSHGRYNINFNYL